jgi:hypothetical protein
LLEAHSCTGLEDCKKESHARNADKLNSERTVVVKEIGVKEARWSEPAETRQVILRGWHHPPPFVQPREDWKTARKNHTPETPIS